jgi:predicted dehydrogenase
MQPLRIGVIGTGSVVREIYQHLYFNSDYTAEIDVQAICDVNEAGLAEFGDQYGIPAGQRFTDYREMIARANLDAVAVNTPDRLHTDPACAAMEAGLDVLVPKPLADRIADADRMIRCMRETGRLIGVDFHKREDPRMKEARTRFRAGDYGRLQIAVWYMVDKLSVADPNAEPRFFATPDFAEKNTPVSFLTVHMADAFMFITDLRPVEVRATGYKHTLPALSPIPVNGYDLVDTEMVMENGCVCHIITGWALPNTAHAVTVQSARFIGSEGLLDLGLDRPGYHEILADGIFERNPMFRNFESDGTVSGYGMSCPGKLLRVLNRFRNEEIADQERENLSTPMSLGFYTTVVCEAAHLSLERGVEVSDGVTRGPAVEIAPLLRDTLGEEAAAEYL